VHEFWNGVAQDDGIKKGDPRKFTSNHLRTVRHGGNSMTLSQLGSPAFSARYLASCFISFTKGDRNRTLIHAIGIDKPIELPGLPSDITGWLV